MSNALMAKFNMKGAKGEKVGFTKKTVYTAIKGIYASFFFLYCIIPRLIPAQSLLEHLFSFINYSPFSEKNNNKKKRCFLTLEKAVLETHGFKSKILPRLH